MAKGISWQLLKEGEKVMRELESYTFAIDLYARQGGHCPVLPPDLTRHVTEWFNDVHVALATAAELDG